MIDSLLEMTWRNPIFMMLAIGAIWFVPGLVVRRVAENKYRSSKAKTQSMKISRLYPKSQKETEK